MTEDYIDYHRGGGFFVDTESDENDMELDEPVSVNVYVYGPAVENNKSLLETNLKISELKKCDKHLVKILTAERNTLKNKLNSTNLFHMGLKNHFISNKFCDVTLKTNDNEQIQTHKLVLASHSEVFASLFDQNSEGNLKEILVNYDSKIIHTILSWMYNPISEIVVNKYNFSFLFEAATEWKIRYIEDQCFNYIKNNKNNFKSYFERVFKINEGTCSFIISNFCDLPEIFIKLLYSKLSNDDISAIVRHDELACPSEEKVYDFVIEWVRFKETERKKYLWDLIQLVRWSFVPESDLSRIVDEPLLQEYTSDINDRARKLSSMTVQMSENSDFYTKHKDDKDYKRRIPRSLGEHGVIVAVRTARETETNTEYLRDCRRDDGPHSWKLLCATADSLFRPTRDHGKVVTFGRHLLYAIGGLSAVDGKPSAQVDMLDLSFYWQRWTPVEPMHHARSHFAVCNDDRYAYIVGGKGVDGEILNTVEVFDSVSGSWKLLSKKNSMKCPRTDHSAVCRDGLIYVVGGKDDLGNAMDVIEVLDPEDGNMTELYIQERLYNAGTIMFNGDLLIVGGRCQQKDEFETSSYVYEMKLLDWRKMFRGYKEFNYSRSKCLAVGREGPSVVALDGDLYVFGGTGSDGGPILETEILDLLGTRVGGPVKGMNAGYVDRNAIVLPEKLLEYAKILLDE